MQEQAQKGGEEGQDGDRPPQARAQEQAGQEVQAQEVGTSTSTSTRRPEDIKAGSAVAHLVSGVAAGVDKGEDLVHHLRHCGVARRLLGSAFVDKDHAFLRNDPRLCSQKHDRSCARQQQDKEEDERRCVRGSMMKIFPCGTPTSWYDTESVERFPNPASRHNHIRQSTMAKRWTLELS